MSQGTVRFEDEPSPWRDAEPRVADSGLVGMSTDWSVPWSDLMMTLFVLFVVLYCYERAERDVGGALRPDGAAPQRAAASTALRDPSLEPAPARRDVFAESRELVRAAALEDVEVARGADETVRLSVHGSTFFDLGKADLRPETRRLLDELAVVLARNPYEVEVVGHTDSFPISSPEYPTNWELSVQRATRVVRYLVERGGLEPGRFTAIGHSMYRPSVPNTTLENKSRNRRVEIRITRRPYAGPPE